MGVDREWQAIPAASPIVMQARAALARGDRDFGLDLLFATLVFRRPALASRHGEVGRLVADLLADDPTIASRTYSSERRNWDQLHYVLSETRRTSHWGCEPAGRDRLFDIAVSGEETLFRVDASPGISPAVCFVEPARVEQVAAALETVSYETMRSSYRAVQMEAAQVYKYATSRHEEYFSHVCDALDELRAFYRTAATNRDGVAIFTT